MLQRRCMDYISRLYAFEGRRGGENAYNLPRANIRLSMIFWRMLIFKFQTIEKVRLRIMNSISRFATPFP